MWSAKTKVIPGATGIIPKSFRKYLSNLPGKHTKELQQTAILGTAHLCENCCEGTKHPAWEITLPVP
jgi:tagatose-1,6-bisphosphate aldolase non-catalytic subunit AgaZ/GatZ